MFKPNTIWGWIRYFICTTEEYSNGEIVERGVQIRLGEWSRLILAVYTTSPGIIVRYLAPDDEQMCDVGWEVSLSLWLPSVAWGHGHYRHNTSRFDGEYYDFGYSFDCQRWCGFHTFAQTPLNERWRGFWRWITRRERDRCAPPCNDFTPPDDMNDIPF